MSKDVTFIIYVTRMLSHNCFLCNTLLRIKIGQQSKAADKSGYRAAKKMTDAKPAQQEYDALGQSGLMPGAMSTRLPTER